MSSLPRVKIDSYKLLFKEKSKKDAAIFAFGDIEFADDPQKKGETKRSLEFVDFFRLYIESFNGEFAKKKNDDKVLYIKSEDVNFNSGGNIIYGHFLGGFSSIGSKIVDKQDPDGEFEGTFVRTTKMVEEVPFYFLIHFPPDKQYGIIIVQGFSTRSFSGIFCDHVLNFVSKCKNLIPRITLTKESIIPGEYVKAVREKSFAKKLVFKSENANPDKIKDILGTRAEGLSIRLEIGKIPNSREYSGSINNFVRRGVRSEDKFYMLEELEGIGFDDYDVEIILDADGETAKLKRSNGFNFESTVYPDPTSFLRDENNHPTIETLHPIALAMLDEYNEEFKES